MALKNSKNSAEQADTSAQSPAPNKAKPPRPPRLKLGCAPLITGICVIVLLGKFLPHEPKRPSTTVPALNTAPRKAKPEQVSKVAPRKAADSLQKPPPLPKPDQLNSEKKPNGTALQERTVIINSPWNGIIRQAERHLKKSLHDADSFKALEWSPVVENKKGYQVRCKFRAKNVLGIYAIQSKTVFLNKAGEVYAVK
jgi:hypothetical protein